MAKAMAAGTAAATDSVARVRLEAEVTAPLLASTPVLLPQLEAGATGESEDSGAFGCLAVTDGHLYWTAVDAGEVWSRRRYHIISVTASEDDLFLGLGVADACEALGEEWAGGDRTVTYPDDDGCVQEILLHEVPFRPLVVVDFVDVDIRPRWPGGSRLKLRLWRDSDVLALLSTTAD